MVEVVGIALVLVLELVKKVEELEREGRRGAECCCRKPARAEELNLMGGDLDMTVTVPDNDAMNPIQVKDHVIVEGGWLGTPRAGEVAELNNLTEGSEGCGFKERTIPFLVLRSVKGNAWKCERVPRGSEGEGRYERREHTPCT